MMTLGYRSWTEPRVISVTTTAGRVARLPPRRSTIRRTEQVLREEQQYLEVLSFAAATGGLVVATGVLIVGALIYTVASQLVASAWAAPVSVATGLAVCGVIGWRMQPRLDAYARRQAQQHAAPRGSARLTRG